MSVRRLSLLVGVSVFLSRTLSSEDLLKKDAIAALKEQCTTGNYQSCVSALKYHGLGKDEAAMAVLTSSAPSDHAAEVYRIAQTRKKDEFWGYVATAGSDRYRNFNCPDALSTILHYHFDLSPSALSDAADDSVKNKFLALSDLLAFPPNAPSKWPEQAQVYRYCFTDSDYLFTVVKSKLGR